MGEGLVEPFKNEEDFRGKFRHQLQITLRNNPYLKDILEHSAKVPQGTVGLPPQVTPISADARDLLTAAAATKEGQVFVRRRRNGTTIHIGGQVYGAEGPRSAARWEGAFGELEDRG